MVGNDGCAPGIYEHRMHLLPSAPAPLPIRTMPAATSPEQGSPAARGVVPPLPAADPHGGTVGCVAAHSAVLGCTVASPAAWLSASASSYGAAGDCAAARDGAARRVVEPASSCGRSLPLVLRRHWARARAVGRAAGLSIYPGPLLRSASSSPRSLWPAAQDGVAGDGGPGHGGGWDGGGAIFSLGSAEGRRRVAGRRWGLGFF
jgi:hypothetical protein